MNAFKLLACGRIIFYNCEVSPPRAELPSPEKEDRSGGFSVDNGTTELEGASAVHLGLSHAAISDKTSKVFTRARRGSKGITSHGRNLIRAGCYWLEENIGKQNLTFLTATLPNVVVMECTPSTWAQVVNRFLKGLRYHLEKHGLCAQVVGCTEVQEKRLRGTNGVPPLHLHLLFQGRKPHKHWAMEKEFYQNLWAQTCRTVWQVESEFAQSCRVERIESSGAAYMSKYLSKGGEVLNQCIPELLPNAWYTLSSALKEIIKANTLRGNSYLATELYNYLYNGELLSWARDVWSAEHGDGSQYLVAWVGQIRTREKYWEMRDRLEYLIYRNAEIQSKTFAFGF